VALSCHIGANLLLPSPVTARSVRAFQKPTRFGVNGASMECPQNVTNAIGSSMARDVGIPSPANQTRQRITAKSRNPLPGASLPAKRRAIPCALATTGPGCRPPAVGAPFVRSLT
jgi:hypothetical protein